MMNSKQTIDKRKKHCMVVHAYYPLGETRVERQAQALLDHNIDVDVICLRFPGEDIFNVVDGINVHRLPVKRHKGSGVLIQLLEYLTFFVLSMISLTTLHLRRNYDLIQIHNLPDFLVFITIIPKLTRTKIILDLHDLMPEFYAERFQKSMESLPIKIIRWQEKVSILFADHVITVTKQWRQTLINRGVPPEKCTVVMNVADERFFYLDNVVDEPNDGQFRIIYHGIMGKRHGLDLALKAMREVRENIHNLCFTLHGAGEYRDTLQNQVEEMGLQDNVHFSYKFMPTAKLAKWIKKADIGIVPYRNSVFTGGILPTKLMEYAALGIPAIASRTKTINAYFDDTMVEFFTPSDVEDLASCIVKLYNDRERLSSLASNITKFNDEYNWIHQSEIYLQLVYQLAGEDS